MAQTPLWIFHGAADGTSPVENDRAIYASIVRAGGTQAHYTEYPDLDHVQGIEKARTEPGLFSGCSPSGVTDRIRSGATPSRSAINR